MLFRRESRLLSTERVEMRLLDRFDYQAWRELRQKNHNFLHKWEPKRYDDQLSLQSFKDRVRWSQMSFKARTAVPMVLVRKSDKALMGAITLDNIRFGPSQSATLGYWLGEEFTGQGYMTEAIKHLVTYAFTDLDISRIEAATLEENEASQRILIRSGFRYEGVAQSYLQINGRWRRHKLYANLRRDRLGETESGVY